MTRPGFGERHADLTSVLASDEPAGINRISWLAGRMPLQVTAYTSIRDDLPDELVTSVRCLVQVGDRLVMCENRDGGRHLMPGGHRDHGETYIETAAREVHEETGWLLKESSVRQIGWLHFEHLGPSLNLDMPYPDFLQVVMRGVADERDGGRNSAWTDIEGWEVGSELVSLHEVATLVSNDLLELAYLPGIR